MGYNNPKDVAVGLIRVRFDRHPIRLAGIYRGKAGDDGFGKPALSGGFVNPGETIEQAVAREGREEIGFVTDPSKWRLLHSRHVPEHNINLVFCLYEEIVEVDILKDAEVSEEVSGFLYIDQTTALAFNLHEEAVQLFYSKYMREAALLESAARALARLAQPDMSLEALRERLAMSAAWEESNGTVGAFCGTVATPGAA
jgi:ADP-ribose pyrophosphatase YjhB (NUDIX family)